MMKKSKKCYLDSNILVSYKLKQSPHHINSIGLLETYMNKNFQFYISPLVLDEFLYSLIKSSQLYKHSVDFNLLDKGLKDILAIPNLEIITPPIIKEDQLKIIYYMRQFNLRPRDAYHLLTMLSNNVSYFATFDNDFEDIFKKNVVLSLKTNTKN